MELVTSSTISTCTAVELVVLAVAVQLLLLLYYVYW